MMPHNLASVIDGNSGNWSRDSMSAPQGPRAKSRLMLVDDSLVIRSIIEQMLLQDDRFEIVASVDNGRKAIEFLQNNDVDIIVLDIEMPIMDGLAALPDIVALQKNARILVLSSNCEEGGAAAVEALALGASDILAKPGRTNFGGRFNAILIDRLARLAENQISPTAAKGLSGLLQAKDIGLSLQIPAQRLEALAIGASTGGITAAIALFQQLASHCHAPIFFTQHLPDAFIPFFAGQLRQSSYRSVYVAKNGDKVRGNSIYLAPGDGHLTVVRGADDVPHIQIDKERSVTGCEPSVDPMFSSLAHIYGSQCCGIILSGMGNDGMVGARALAQCGAPILAQNPETCVVWGMPGSVVRDGSSAAILSPEAMANFINQWAEAQS